MTPISPEVGVPLPSSGKGSKGGKFLGQGWQIFSTFNDTNSPLWPMYHMFTATGLGCTTETATKLGSEGESPGEDGGHEGKRGQGQSEYGESKVIRRCSLPE